ncbi:hypothetical protein CK203_078358 [Vitis vinifera]|uniref:Uncharacterized protein n=1 Tax=Vitis vinifera TaxID=29760 RepID=A0A438DXM7_VITVI|nr:hypothetical protein CK203_078358 [Vitis vinifera]
MAPRSMCPMLTHRGVTQMTYFFATITLVLSVYSSPTTTLQIFTTTTIDGLFSMKQLCFHHTTVYWAQAPVLLEVVTQFGHDLLTILVLGRLGSVHSAFVPFANMEKSGVASTSGRIQRGRAKLSQSSRFLTRHLIDELFEQEFCVCCYIPNSIFIQLSNEDASSTNRFPHNMIPFVFIYPNVLQIPMGCGVLDTLYQLDLSLLEVLFVYTIKMSLKERFSLSTYISSLQFIIRLPYSSKSWGN